MFAQEKSSTFYSSYDARELVEERKYKGIDFAYGDASSESISELRGGGSEKTKSISYGCRIQTTEEDAFNLADFLNWLAKETIKQIESGDGRVVRERHKTELSGAGNLASGEGFRRRPSPTSCRSA